VRDAGPPSRDAGPAARGLRGTALAAGFLLDERLLGHGELVRRVLALWEPGARLRQTRAGPVVQLARPRRTPVNASPGAPLVAAGGVLCGTTIDEARLRALAPPPGAILLRQGGAIVVIADAEERSPAAWIDPGELEVIETRGLTGPVHAPFTPPPVISLREVLGPEVPPPADGREAFLRELAGGGAEAGARAGASAPSLRASGPLGGVLRALAGALRGWWGGGASRPDGRGSTPPAAAPPSVGMFGWLARLAARASGWIGIHRLLGRRHGAYIARLVAMLEGGDVREALRHAIPLATVKGLRQRRPAGLLWFLRPRASLQISPAGAQASSALTLADDLFARMQRLYRNTFQRLDAQGRHEEAAFVLAELLQQDEEAVAYLERQGQLRRAAELAEARGCAPGLIVRAWLLAGDRARAVRVARERGAFHDAIVRLQQDHPEAARGLRLLWAEALASAGDYAQAVAVAHELPAARALVLHWLEVGLGAGEAQAPRLLAFRAALVPELWPDTRARAEAWMSAGDGGADDPVAAARRRALAEALPAVPARPETRLLARRCARVCVVHAAHDRPPLHPQALRALLRLAEDEALEADLPSERVAPRPTWRDQPQPLVASLPDRGLVAIQDAVLLASGRLLVAHGDAGVALLAPSGQTLHHFDVPADRLVISDACDRAIALAARGEATQLGLLDLATRRARPWGLARLACAADSYDGTVWFAADQGRLLALDVLGDQPRCFWSVELDEDAPVSLARDRERLVVLAGGWGIEVWRYELPALILRQRTPVRLGALIGGPSGAEGGGAGAPPPVVATRLVCLDGTVHALVYDPGAGELGVVATSTPPRQIRLPLEAPGHWPQHQAAASAPGWLALALTDAAGARVRLFDEALEVRADLDLPGAARATVRFSAGHLVVGCDRGRLVTLDLDDGTLRARQVGQ
jgi:hypothetical protein